ncbi:hypothetical protein ACFRMQ_03640 [Kitasatospora sp. NPDC056783]|uniref:hypothetical protein n=1 Tax=Kitasatospora sp. NPDC056783 TaxID=3345943 RepID=UPI0036A8B9DB
MSTESMPGSGSGSGSAEAEAATAWGLSELAGGVEAGEVPYDRLVAGGRRRLRRRRLLTAGMAAALVVGVAGGTAVLGERGRDAVSTVVAASASAPGVTAPASPATPDTPSGPAAPAPPGPPATPRAPGARDPFHPVRVKVAEGTASGHTWQAWAALWPAAPTKEDFATQLQLIRAERYAANPDVKPVTQESIDINWSPRIDRVNYYYLVDGERQKDDALPAVSGAGQSPSAVGAASLGLQYPSDVPPVVIGGVQPEVTKVVVAWKTGGATEAATVAVGDSPFRFFGLGAKPGSDAAKVTYYAADGSEVRTADDWLRTS